MGCFIAIIAMLSPRLALFLVWLFSDRFDVAFDTNVVPLLGFFLLPWTTLVYTFAYHPLSGVSGIGWFFVGIAFVADIASYGSSEYQRRRM